MKTEREIFDEWYKSEYPLDYEHYVNEQDIGLFTKLYLRCFASWKASASREGYKLVPVEPTLKMSVAYEKNSIAPVSSLSVAGYKAMIGACDDH